MCSTRSQSYRFRNLLSLTLFIPYILSTNTVIAGALTTTSEQNIPTSLCSGDAVTIPDMGLSSGINRSRGEVHAEPGPYEHRHPQVPLDVEGYSVAPAGLELQQVHVFVRHGERTPVGVRLADAPANIPAYWNMCKTAKRFKAAVAETTDTPKTEKGWNASLETRRLVERRDGTVVEGECLLGELTDVGKQSTYNFGLALREIYSDRLGFIPNVLDDVRGVYFRSTNIPRTVETLQQVIHGLYPNEKCINRAYPPLLVRNAKDESLVANGACRRLSALLGNFTKAAAEAYNPMLEPLDKKLSKYINGEPVRLDGQPRASGILDTIFSAKAHGIKVPREFEDRNVIALLEQAVVQEWFAGYKTEEVRRLAMGRLLEDLTNKMQYKIEKGHRDPLKFLVHATHDAGIAGLCSTLDVFDEKWPPFTASITFELFKRYMKPESQQQGQPQGILAKLGSGAPSMEYYVRMRYQNKSMALPLCAEKGKHLDGAPEFCTFKAFRDRIRELVPEDWDAECMSAGRS